MAIPTQNELIRLLEDQRETLTVEHKGWLDLSSNDDKAIIAKAAIALANEGGGIIVLGTREDKTQGGKLGSYPRPSDLTRYSKDDINGIITRFADPPFHCELDFAQHPVTKIEHAFVIVPGGMTVPVMARKGSASGVIEAQCCYVRKPGPKSEEPYTSEEWGRLFSRCIQAGRENMLDAIRAIVQGYTEPGTIHPSAKEGLQEFITTSETRWESLITSLPEDDPARMPLGYYEIAFSILGVEQPLSLADLRRRMDEASNISLTGWPPFLYLHREPYMPHSINGTIEVWLGDPSGERNLVRDSSDCDYWRAHPMLQFFKVRGYDEDSSSKVPPGTVIDMTMPIWRVGETLLYASRLAKLLGDNPEILVMCRYTGLSGRLIVGLYEPYFGLEGGRSFDDVVDLETQVTAQQIDDNLSEVLQSFLHPLYERFNFFELNPTLLSRQVERLKGKRS